MVSPDTEVGRIHWEGPQRNVSVNPFLLARTEVSTFTYKRFGPGLLPHNYFGIPLSCDSQPVCWIEKKEAEGWCSSLGLRLPSEAEWEYACRAGTSTPFFWGETPDSIYRFANIADQSALNVWPSETIEILKERCSNLFSSANDGFGVSAPVGSYYPNAFGLYDMAGNVWEWCEDYWHSGYCGAPSDGGPMLKVSSDHVVRGGGWKNSAFFARAASRSDSFVGSGPDIGFRPAASVRLMIGDK